MHGDDHTREQIRGIQANGKLVGNGKQQAGEAQQGKEEIKNNLPPGLQQAAEEGIPHGGQHPAGQAGGQNPDRGDHSRKIGFIDLIVYTGVDDTGDASQQTRYDTQQ